MTACPYCPADVDDLAAHYSHNPPLGCPVVAVALDLTYFPYVLADADPATVQRRAARRASAKPRGGKREPLPVVDGQKYCRCLRGPAGNGGKCVACRRVAINAWRGKVIDTNPEVGL